MAAANGGNRSPVAELTDGAIAGAVASTVLNMVTYLDMVVRARPASSTPEETVQRLADVTGVDLGPEDRAANRRSGLGPLLGYLIGVGTGAGYALLRAGRRTDSPRRDAALLGAALMLTSSGSMTVLKVTDPRQWRGSDWLTDIIPHLGYGLTAVATWNRLRPSRDRCR